MTKREIFLDLPVLLLCILKKKKRYYYLIFYTCRDAARYIITNTHTHTDTRDNIAISGCECACNEMVNAFSETLSELCVYVCVQRVCDWQCHIYILYRALNLSSLSEHI